MNVVKTLELERKWKEYFSGNTELYVFHATCATNLTNSAVNNANVQKIGT